MITHVKGNLLDFDEGIILHQVNCQGRMNSGVAKQIREKYPIVFEEYKLFCSSIKPDLLLGKTQKVLINNKLTIYNLFGQLYYGYDGKCYTSYRALQYALESIKNEIPFNVKIAIPYKMGCCRGGGDWNIVYKLINDIFINHEVIMYEYEEQ